MLTCAGVDGSPAGWVVATRRAIHVVERIDDALELADVIGIDMPIGLPDGPERAADRAARSFVSPRGSSVFPTLPRPLVALEDYAAANRCSRSLFGKGISKQAFMLRRHIVELDDLMSPELEDRIVEVHPECSFRLLAGHPLPSKHTVAGLQIRTTLAEEIIGELPARPRGARQHDLLDAIAVLFTAERFARGEHLTLPAGTAERDQGGLRMRVVI